MLLPEQEHPAGAFHQRLSWKLFPPKVWNTYPGWKPPPSVEDAAQVPEDVVVDVVIGAVAVAADPGPVDHVVVDLVVVGVGVELNSPSAALCVVPAAVAVGAGAIPDPVVGDHPVSGVVVVDAVVQLVAGAEVVDLVVGDDDAALRSLPRHSDPVRPVVAGPFPAVISLWVKVTFEASMSSGETERAEQPGLVRVPPT